MNISILKLSRETTQQDLNKLFSKFGRVKSCDIVTDKVSGKSKGFGFVEMPEDDKALTAIKCLHGREVDGSKIKVKAVTNSNS